MLGMERGTSEKVRKFVRNFDFPVICITMLLLQMFQQIVICLFSWGFCQFFRSCLKGFLFSQVQGSSERRQRDMAVLQADKVKENQKLVLQIENFELFILWSLVPGFGVWQHTVLTSVTVSTRFARTKYSGCKESARTPVTSQASNKCWQ